MKEHTVTKLAYRTLAYPTLTDEQINRTAEVATRAYFEALTEQGRVFDHAELTLMIDIAIEGEETRLFVERNR